MSNWRSTEAYRKIAEANRQFYSQIADLYEATERCVTDGSAQSELESDLDRVLEHLGRDPKQLSALDACGGAGNVSLKLLRRGLDVVLVDISPELQEIYRRKCIAAGYTPHLVCDEIGRYLSESERQFDLIAFSSALHHLQDVEGVLALAFQRLAPGGLLFTTYDPTLRAGISALSRIALRIEYIGFKLFCQTGDVPKAALRKLSRMFAGSTPENKSQVEIDESTVGMLAEYHVEHGIDDVGLVDALRQTGYEVVEHVRRAETRFKWTEKIVVWKKDVTAFKLMLRKPAIS